MPEITNDIDGIGQKPVHNELAPVETVSAKGNPTLEENPPERPILSSSDVMTILIILFAAFLFVAIWADSKFIIRLSDSAYARGLITWLICVSTMGIAFVLIYQSFSTSTTDDSYRRAREILTGLMGVMGTIIGFYFGSATELKQQLLVEPVSIMAEELLSTVSGGQAPYTYTVRFSQSGVPPISGEIPVAGDFEAPKPKDLTEGTIEIAVVDQRNEKSIAETKITNLPLEPPIDPLPASDAQKSEAGSK